MEPPWHGGRRCLGFDSAPGDPTRAAIALRGIRRRIQRRVMRRRSTVHRLSAVAVAAAGTIVAGVLAAPPAYAAVPTHTIAQVQGTGASTPVAERDGDGRGRRHGRPPRRRVQGLLHPDARAPTSTASGVRRHLRLPRRRGDPVVRDRRPGPRDRRRAGAVLPLTRINASGAGASVEVVQAGVGRARRRRRCRDGPRLGPRGVRGHARARPPGTYKRRLDATTSRTSASSG